MMACSGSICGLNGTPFYRAVRLLPIQKYIFDGNGRSAFAKYYAIWQHETWSKSWEELSRVIDAMVWVYLRLWGWLHHGHIESVCCISNCTVHSTLAAMEQPWWYDREIGETGGYIAKVEMVPRATPKCGVWVEWQREYCHKRNGYSAPFCGQYTRSTMYPCAPSDGYNAHTIHAASTQSMNIIVYTQHASWVRSIVCKIL